MWHKNSHLDVKQDDHSRDHSTLCPKPNSDNHTSKLDEVSPAIKQEPYDLQQRQSSEAPHDVPETHEGASTLSCNNETKKDSDMLVQKPSSDPGIPEQEPNTPLVSQYMGDCSKIPKDEPVDLHLRQSTDSGVKTSVCVGETTSSVKREVVKGTNLPVQSFKWVPVVLSEKQKPTQPTQPEKTSEKLQPRRNPHLGPGCSSQSDQITVPLSVSQKLCSVPKEPQANNSQPRQCIDARNHALLSKEEKGTNAEGESVSPNLVQMSSSGIGVPIPQPGQGNYIYSNKFEKVEKLQPRRNPDPVVQESQSGAESDLSKVFEPQSGAESSQTKVTDRGSDDGYNWRKYGQKLVKGNNFSRSYYKCTYPNCQAKKQVERSHDGCKTEVNYIANHHHEKPQQISQVTSALQVRIPEMPIVPASKTNSEPIIDHGDANQQMGPPETSPQSTVAGSSGVTGAVSCSNDDNKDKDYHPDSKRQKMDVTSPDDHVVNKSNCDLRHVVQTLSEVDVVNDGYRWRKYGQKLVKGNPNPRSYYRCSYAGCPVKKHVERASHDSKVVITTYEGKHDHDMPASRSVNQSVARSDADLMTRNGESSSKPEENNPVSVERVVHVSAN